MPDVLNLLPQAVSQPQAQILQGQVSKLKPAPEGFDDPLYVEFPLWHTDYFFTIHGWPACHGETLPSPGAEVLAVYDDQRVLRCAWWDGVTMLTAPPDGPAGGVLTGSYPNPGIVPASSGDVTGTYPNLTIAPNAVTVSKMAPASSGGIASETIAVYQDVAFSLNIPLNVNLGFNKEEIDPSGRFDGHLYVPKVSGYYMLTSTVFIQDALASTDWFTLALYKNGSLLKNGSIVYGTTAADFAGSTVTAVALANGTTDNFSVRANWSTGSITVQTGAQNNYLAAHLIGPT